MSSVFIVAQKLDSLLYDHVSTLTKMKNPQKYAGSVDCCEYGVNVHNAFTVLCRYLFNERVVKR